MHKVYFRPRAVKGLKKASKKHQLKINENLDILSGGSLKVLDITKLSGTRNGYRLRVGNWRVLFSLLKDEKIVEIVDIFQKKGQQDYRKRIQELRK